MSFRDDAFDNGEGPDEIFDGAWGEPSPEQKTSPRRRHPGANHPAFGPGRTAKPSETKPPLPDMDQPPVSAAPIVAFSLRERFAWAGMTSEFFPVIVSLMAVAAVLLAGFGPLGRLASFALLGAWWVLGIRIHVTEEHRLTLHLAEATIIGLLIYWS